MIQIGIIVPLSNKKCNDSMKKRGCRSILNFLFERTPQEGCPYGINIVLVQNSLFSYQCTDSAQLMG